MRQTSEDSINHWQTLSVLGQHLWPKGRTDLRVRVVLALLCLALAKVLNVYVPFLFKDSIDLLSAQEGLVVLPLALIVSYGLARLLVALFGELRDFIFVKVAQHAQRDIGLKTFQHLHNLSLDFHLARQTGGLSRVIERGTRGIQFVLHFMTFNIVPTLLEIVLVAGVLVYKFGYLFALIVVGTIAVYIFFTLWITEWRLKYRKEMNDSESRANTKAIDSLINFETVKYFGNEEHEYARFDRSLARYETAAVRSQWSLSLLNFAQATVIGIGLVALMIISGQGVVAGTYTIGDFVLVHTFLIQLYMPLNFLGFVYREIKNSLVDMEKMFELIKVNPSVSDRPDAKDLEIQAGRVEFKNVDFSYNQDRQILRDVTFEIGEGKTVAVVGPSGSGKSTLARLLFRFYDIQAGAILVDGKDIRDLTQKTLRAQIGVVPQDTVLFNESIGYNIQYGRPSASWDEVRQAARLANIDLFIESLPQGYDTEVGERGLKLSGGEKQRIAIARTILKGPKILIFDEATSALDSHKEKEIQKALREISKKRSTLIIAHRLSTIVDADEILVMREGRIIERGRHHQLLGLKGEYADLWHRQQEVQEYERKLQDLNLAESSDSKLI